MANRVILLTIVSTVALVIAPAPATTQEPWDRERPDAHAPLGIPHGHLLERGRVLVGYRYDYGRFEGLRSGTDGVEAGDVFALGYRRAPRWRNAHRHVVEAMYAPGDRLTLVAEVPLVHSSMTMQRRTGGDVEVRASGLGDVRVGGLFGIIDRAARRAHVGLLVALPTGAADERGETEVVPYVMQPGSGTVGLSPSATLVEHRALWSWGAHLDGNVYLGDGSEGWAPGNAVAASLWASRRLMPWASGSVRAAGEFRGDVRADVTEFPASPASEPGLTGGNRVELIVGANLHAAAGIYLGHRLFGELAVPVYQDLHGPQLGTQWRGSLGWRWTFGGD
jgi:hypothetical protein